MMSDTSLRKFAKMALLGFLIILVMGYPLNVYAATKTVKVKTDQNYTVYAGKSKKLKVKTNTPCRLTFKSANASIVSVSKGKIYGLKPGKTTIKITASPYSNKYKKKNVTVKVTVKKPQKSYDSHTKELSLEKEAPLIDKNITEAFKILGFKVYIDNRAKTAGYFSAQNRLILIAERKELLYHEIGHFIAFATGNRDQKNEFTIIFNKEKNKYTRYNKLYITGNQAEYFAESVSDYYLDRKTLKNERPLTFKYIKTSIKRLTPTQANLIWSIYGNYWEKQSAERTDESLVSDFLIIPGGSGVTKKVNYSF